MDDSRFTLIDHGAPVDDFAADVRRGLTASPKFLLPHYFYDALGSALFDAICHLPEYYPTRCEDEILSARAGEIARELGSPVRLIELGSGSARKTRHLLTAITELQGELEYLPVDVDPVMLERAAGDLLHEYPRLRVRAIRSDFRNAATALPPGGDTPTAILFLGSTIGNLTFSEAVSMLSSLRATMKNGDAFFLGADLRKPREVLEPAYDDPLGVTASFNLNLLLRINRELGGNFALDRFRHRAFYDDGEGRIEMHLVSTAAQRVRIEDLGLDIEFADGESIHTENSYKYDEETLGRIATASGLRIAKIWTDRRGWFADVLMRPS